MTWRPRILYNVTLELAVAGLTSEDVVEFNLNGKALPDSPPIEMYPRARLGPSPNSYQGNYTLTSAPQTSYGLTPLETLEIMS